MEFEDRDIIESPEALRELEELGYFSTPVTLIGDEAVVGFNRQKLKTIIGVD